MDLFRRYDFAGGALFIGILERREVEVRYKVEWRRTTLGYGWGIGFTERGVMRTRRPYYQIASMYLRGWAIGTHVTILVDRIDYESSSQYSRNYYIN